MTTSASTKSKSKKSKTKSQSVHEEEVLHQHQSQYLPDQQYHLQNPQQQHHLQQHHQPRGGRGGSARRLPPPPPLPTSTTTTTTLLPTDETNDAPEILLSLSKSFDRLDNGSSSKRRGPTITFTTNSTFGDDDDEDVIVVEGKERHYPPHQHRTVRRYEQHLQQEEQQQDARRPTSPRGPPRIQHWHKQSMSGSDCSSFEPSPVRLPHLTHYPEGTTAVPPPPPLESPVTNIDLSSSFNLFNESFDMNLEGLIGPNSSFGYLGPMKSLSFGLGLNGSVDYGDVNVRMSPNGGSSGGLMMRRRQQYLKMSPTNTTDDGMENEDGNDGGSGVGDGGGKKGVHGHENGKQQLSSFHEGERITTAADTDDNVNSSTSTPYTHVQVLNGSTTSSSSLTYGNDVFRKAPGRTPPRTQQRMEPSRFGAMERHHSVFSTFSFLLPGAKTTMENKSREDAVNCQLELSSTEKEVARRRVNSALCAFGGIAIPSSEEFDSMDRSKRLRWMQSYRDSIPERYYEDESRLSWEIEEHPPIEISESEEEEDKKEGAVNGIDGKQKASMGDHHHAESNFHCKLCGAAKRQHDCPYNSSLHRNIGVMVYPAVNAFTATEPGIITPALSDVNNFVDHEPPTESTPAKTQEEITVGSETYLPMVTPDSIRPGSLFSPPAMDGKTPQRSVNYAGGAWISNHQSPRNKAPGGKSPDSNSTDLLFLDTQELQPEQYRTVGERKKAKKKRKSSSARIRYLYPALPLPYGQRKRISNAMFAMSKSIPGLTDECASVLGDARREDAWDFAVAQLMTQVIVVTHCSAEDRRLDGLSKYLLTLG
ncbi:hypothetical protein ACHAWU_007365 [Discostella pseudostelligera]|uniref:Uncharacterized protein n=1 Tax=Discostella pseudostelligera TaxID=259834 RepID=A0ABD3MHJ2_9STRA